MINPPSLRSRCALCPQAQRGTSHFSKPKQFGHSISPKDVGWGVNCRWHLCTELRGAARPQVPALEKCAW